MDNLDKQTANPEHQKFVDWNSQTKEKMSSIKKMASKRVENIPFGEEFKAFFLLGYLGKTICNIVSFCTMYIALWLVWGNVFGYYTSIVFAIVTALILEGLKLIIFKLSFKYILRYKVVGNLTVTPIVLISVVTICFSLIGAYYLPSMKAPKDLNLIALNDIEKIKADTSNINKARLSASGFFTNSSKTRNGKTYISSTNKDARAVHSEKESLLSVLVMNHENTVQNAIKENELLKGKNEIIRTKAKKDLEHENTMDRWLFVGVAAFLEMLFFILAFCVEYYLTWVGVDNMEDEEEREKLLNNMNKRYQFSLSGSRSSESGEIEAENDKIKPSIQFNQGEKETAVATADKSAVVTAETVEIQVDKTAVATADKSAIATAENEDICKLVECSIKFKKTVHNKEFCCKEHQQLYNQKARLLKGLKDV